MADTMDDGNASTTAEQWGGRIADQRHSGLSVKQFCAERGISTWSFYKWRKQLSGKAPVRFALVERGTERQESSAKADLEVIFASGDRLRIRSGADPTTLRTVLRVMRG